MDKIYIFGAGKRGMALRKLLKSQKIVHVAAFIDNDPKKSVEGENCISVEDAIKDGAQNEWVIVSPMEYQSIENQLKEQNFKYIFCWSKFLPHPEYCIPIIWETTDYKNVKPFNHYESPYPDIVKVHDRENELFDKTKEVLDIDFNMSRQLELIEKMKVLNLPEWKTGGGV